MKLQIPGGRARRRWQPQADGKKLGLGTFPDVVVKEARDLRGALANPKPKHHAAILEPRKVGALLRSIDGYEGDAVTFVDLQLSALLFVRPGELRMAEWAEIDFGTAVWRIRAERMKGRIENVVPLSRQAIALLRKMQELTGDGRYVFPSIRTPAWPHVGKHRERRAATVGPADPLFPATRMGLGATGALEAQGRARNGWAGTTPIRDIFKRAFAGAGCRISTRTASAIGWCATQWRWA